MYLSLKLLVILKNSHHMVYNNIYIYIYIEFPPPDMREGCEAFLGGWEVLVENELMKRQNNEDVVAKICNVLTRACHNVDPANAPKFDNKIMVDGQPVDVSPDGSVPLDRNEDL